jgi:hypothetical protein
MFGICFSILVIMAILSLGGEMAMRVRLTRRESSRDKFIWWRTGGDAVNAAYEEIFPGTRLPILRRFAFWLVIACALVLVFKIWFAR